jgi:hypothetical protein
VSSKERRRRDELDRVAANSNVEQIEGEQQ